MNLFITREAIGELVELAGRYRLEAARCADEELFVAGCVMMGASAEAMLFCTVCMSEHVLRELGLWPESKSPSDWSLGELVGIATRAGWFNDRGIPGTDLAAAVQALNYLRTCAIHPAAYIREGATPMGEREFAASFAVLESVDEALTAVLDQLPDPPQP